MISATVAGSHRFGTVRRRGYDPAEVDAVVERLADALAASQDRVQALERRLEESEVSAAAISRTLAVVESTKVQMIDEAGAEATAIVTAAHKEAATVAGLAESLGWEISARRDAILTKAYDEADEVVLTAELAVADQAVAAARSAEQLVLDAAEEARHRELASDADIKRKELSLAWAMRAAAEQAERRLAEAEQKAARIVRDAEFEHERLTAKLSGIREALHAIRSAAAVLADDTIERTRVIDLAAVEAARIQVPPELITLDEAPAEPEPETVEQEDEVDTFYQRRGRTLRERIEIARAMP